MTNEVTTQEMHRLEDWLGLTLNGFLLASLIEFLRYDAHARGHYLDDSIWPSKTQNQPFEGPFTPQALRLVNPNTAAPFVFLSSVLSAEELNHTWVGKQVRERQTQFLQAAHRTAQAVFDQHAFNFLEWNRRRFLIDWNGDKKKGPDAQRLADWHEPQRTVFLETWEAIRHRIPYQSAQWHRKKRAFYTALWGADDRHWRDNFGFNAPLYDSQREGVSDLGASLRQYNAYAQGLGKPGLWFFADYSDFCEPNAWIT
ncbi:hypothetical protein [Sulfobacillus thermosulfidooxidans]|uniref:hypothetical protein n=1 Tax=Sulfobacillus thermosulfidooxidans TaxID=28034 RepID=UPI0006B5F7B1|nr:hypothetical protein [Sulfobacillus thermosulfidooxidans]